MKIILHISDLHVSLYHNKDGSISENIKSYLTTNPNEDSSFSFINKFIGKVKEFKTQKEVSEVILLITGDIANTGEKKEYEFAIKFIKRIIKELEIDKFLIIPGDHDVNRRSLDNYLVNNPTRDSHLLNEIKFTYFKEFYKEIKGDVFEYDKVIFDYLKIDEKIVLIALNSNFLINQNDGVGYIQVEKFRSELEELKKEFSEDTNIICCWHHNISSNYENKNSGQWDEENRKLLLAELLSQNIKLVLTGNEHTSGAKEINLEIQTSDCGAFCDTVHNSSFKIYQIIYESENIKFKNIRYNLNREGNNDLMYYWNLVEDKGSYQKTSFTIFEKNEVVVDGYDELPEGVEVSSLSSHEKMESVTMDSEEVLENSDKLYQIIKNKKLFHSGHFHWSETSRAHNWIDVSKLLESKDDLLFVKNAIIDVINSHNLANDCDLMIGLGYEGNLIASKAAIKYDLLYSYLPYSYRYKDHHDYENKLNLLNKDGSIKKVIIITDVVNDGKTIRKLIGKREKEFFLKVEKIIVISLIYTGEEVLVKKDILNSSVQKNFDSDLDEDVNNIEFYTIKKIKVEKCPYGKDYARECLIYKDDLSCVNLFYDDKNVK